ncbi:alkylation response protein AidB-like acyl-CoA dehydrogenase [Antricoccus suffuscus]|uniref:Alkylation response protein AidB-like acyl-CoA dehydrogenase n=1 Tax=Antricoccus suffuscus TaxID=1629062 RepID=A0A2T1A0Y4_9ACTN|nr:acyl-CoA dehydrogenase family protein [Antricoccus suffuscus]PRZ42270.1 alkylation response protein AidB-like acyl-CoA dehydrogenase [Antricoccus suffuscus]
MDFSLTSEQESLRKTVSSFLSKRYDLDASRRAARSGVGWQPEIWQAFADEIGILGATLPAYAGGLDGGAEELMVIAEELGRALVVEPFVGTVVVGAGLLRRAGGSAADAVLEGIASGRVRVAYAAAEPDSYPSGHDVTTTAVRDGDGWVLSGAKTLVLDAPLATHLVICARTSGDRRATGGLSLFLLEFDAANAPAGMSVHSYRTIDDRHAADIDLSDVRLPADALIGEVDEAWSVIEPMLDEGTAAVCAEAVGLMRKVVADTVQYAKERRQFGQPIGTFQVLQHRMVDMHIELERAVSAAYLAILHLGDDRAVRGRAVSAAKATVSQAARFIGQNAVQLHGGMGMTQELAIGHYFRRLTAIESEFGSADFHRARYASLTTP